MIKTLIVDDHPLVRAGFKKIVEEEIDITVVGECQNASEVLRFLDENKCDVIVLDIDMPGRSGIDLLPELKRMAAEMKVLIQSIHPEEQHAIRALKAGAAGYITKETAAEELVEAIRQIYYGGRYVSRSLAQKLAFDLENSDKPPHELLSDREYHVLQLIGAGKSPKEIAAVLFLSLNTVNTYRKRILEKMGLKSTQELMHYALKHNLAS